MTLYLGSQRVCPTITVGEPTYYPRTVENGVLKSTPISSFETDDNITAIGSYGLACAFSYNTTLTSINLNNVETIGEGGCRLLCNYSNITTLTLPNVTALTGSTCFDTAFAGTPITTITFSKLESMAGYSVNQLGYGVYSTFSIYFPSLKPENFQSDNNQFYRMLYRCYGTTTVHFPSNFQSIIGDWSVVVGGFNTSGSATVLFDLPAST